MNKISLIPLLLLTLLVACASENTEVAQESHGDEHAEEAFARGPHGGRLLEEGDFGLELAIFESGVPPEFRAWPTWRGEPVDPTEVDLSVELTRLGGTVDRIGFTPQGDYLRGDQKIVEPHSFDAKVTARHAGRTYTWSYPSYEGRTTIAADAAEQAGIETAVAGPGTIAQTITLYGSIRPDATRVREVKARFPGVVQRVNKQIGDAVRAGEILAVVESNESLQTYTVTSPIGGVITERHADPGEQTGEEPLFEVADFSRVWAEFSVFPRDRARVRAGQRVRVSAENMGPAEGSISYISPLGSRNSQSVTARVVLDNGEPAWTPGQFVEGQVVIEEMPVDVAVPLSALQTFRDFTVVFAQVGEAYEVRMLELGRRDTERVEVLGGLEPGTSYVTENSYLIKADIEKSGASHDH